MFVVSKTNSSVLWCYERKDYYGVINGAWDFTLNESKDVLTVTVTGHSFEVEVFETPWNMPKFEYNEYNEAIEWFKDNRL